MNNSCRKIICVTGKMASGKNTVCSILEQNGFISPAEGSKPRQVLISLEEYNLGLNYHDIS